MDDAGRKGGMHLETPVVPDGGFDERGDVAG